MLRNYFLDVAKQEVPEIQTISQEPAGCSKRPSSRAAASEEAEAYSEPYVEPLSAARTPLADFFNSLLALYIADRAEFRHCFCDSRTIDRFDHFRDILIREARFLRQTRH